MSLEDRREQHDQQVVEKYQDPRFNILMTTRDYVVRPHANNITGALLLGLPRVAEAKGRWYSIICRDADVVNTVTITDQNDSECWQADVVFNSPCDGALFYSDGLCWIVLPITYPGSPHTLAPETRNPTTLAPTTFLTTVGPTTISTSQVSTIAPTTTI
jgi:hypothetical protein